MKEKNEYPTMSRKDHNKRSDSPKGCHKSPKGGKFASILMSLLGSAASQGQQAEQSWEEKSKARMRAGMGNKVIGN